MMMRPIPNTSALKELPAKDFRQKERNSSKKEFLTMFCPAGMKPSGSFITTPKRKKNLEPTPKNFGAKESFCRHRAFDSQPAEGAVTAHTRAFREQTLFWKEQFPNPLKNLSKKLL